MLGFAAIVYNAGNGVAGGAVGVMAARAAPLDKPYLFSIDLENVLKRPIGFGV